MSRHAVIKSHDAAHMIVPISDSRRARATAPAQAISEPSSIERELAATKAALVASETQAKQLEQAWEERFADAVADARRAIEAQFRADDQARVTALVKAADAAVAAFTESLAVPAEHMAIALASRALSRLGTERSNDIDLLAAIVRSEIEKLPTNALVSLQLSSADAQNPDWLAPLQAAIPRGVVICPDDSMADGTVRLRLRLGHVDVSIADGLARLAALLLVEGEPA
jgi:flagellar biosynthesis/type III secretory pathway protein FliH